jgi:thiol-disulfide isomerase/thioredoxin
MKRWACLAVTLALLVAAGSARGDADRDWQTIEAMDTAGPQQQYQSRDEAQAATVDYLGKQEAALKDFVAEYPSDARVIEAKLRLAHLYGTLADISQDPTLRRKSDSILNELEAEPAMKDRKADVEFARVSIFMQRVDSLTGANREPLIEKARAFAKEFPDDHRVAPLLTDVASAFEDEPRTAIALLNQALPKAQDAALRARIDDDLKRLGLVGKPLDMRWAGVDGTAIDLREMRGKVVIIYFFASWSAPSMAALDWVNQLAAHYPADTVQALGICLDNDPVAVPNLLADHQIPWPVYCDGQGWHGTLVRSLGVNAIPALWILDRQGIVLTLDAKNDAPAIIDRAASDSGE